MPGDKLSAVDGTSDWREWSCRAGQRYYIYTCYTRVTRRASVPLTISLCSSRRSMRTVVRDCPAFEVLNNNVIFKRKNKARMSTAVWIDQLCTSAFLFHVHNDVSHRDHPHIRSRHRCFIFLLPFPFRGGGRWISRSNIFEFRSPPEFRCLPYLASSTIRWNIKLYARPGRPISL